MRCLCGKREGPELYYFYEEKGAATRAAYSDALEFGAHIHGHLEFVYMLDGGTKAEVDFQAYTVGPGDGFLVFPNQVHRYYQDQVRRCIVVIFPPELCPEFRPLLLGKQPRSPVVPRARLSPQVLPLLEKIVAGEADPPPFYETLRKGYFLELLSLVLAEMDLADQGPADSITIKRVLNTCAEQFTSDITLETLAGALHVNKCYISHLFGQKLHMGFRQYINMLRISEAQRLLRRRESTITQIAFAVGFNSTRSFNRVFIARVGMTPRQYQAGEGSGE